MPSQLDNQPLSCNHLKNHASWVLPPPQKIIIWSRNGLSSHFQVWTLLVVALSSVAEKWCLMNRTPGGSNTWTGLSVLTRGNKRDEGDDVVAPEVTVTVALSSVPPSPSPRLTPQTWWSCVLSGCLPNLEVWRLSCLGGDGTVLVFFVQFFFLEDV